MEIYFGFLAFCRQQHVLEISKLDKRDRRARWITLGLSNLPSVHIQESAKELYIHM